MKSANRRQLTTLVAGAAVAGFVVSKAPDYWLFLLTTAAVNAIMLQSVGVVAGRCGMIALCQMSFVGLGAWTVAWLGVHGAPGTVVMWAFAGGVAAVPAGLFVAVLSVRLRGASLAIATLGMATLFDAIFAAMPFPGELELQAVPRPDVLNDERVFFVFAAAACAITGGLVHGLSRTNVGLSWTMLGHSERATAAVGHSVLAAKLSAFAVSAFIAGIAGGLLTAQLGGASAVSFSLMTSLTLFAAGTMMRTHRPTRAAVGGIVAACLPAVMHRVGLSQDVVGLIVAVGAIHALRTEGTPRDREAAFDTVHSDEQPDTPRSPCVASAIPPIPSFDTRSIRQSPVLEVVDLMVTIDSVPILNRVSFTVDAGTAVGVVGPNGAGKSTLLDALSGFVQSSGGRCVLNQRDIGEWSACERARAGIRRTWQQPRIATELTVEDYVRLSVGRPLTPDGLREYHRWLNGYPLAGRVARLTMPQRRRLEAVAAALTRPRVLLLDEPLAGQSDEELDILEEIVNWSIRQRGAVLLVEHNERAVRRLCESIIAITPQRSQVSASWAVVQPAFADTYRHRLGDKHETPAGS